MNNWVWKPRNNENRSHTSGIINTNFLFDCLGYVFSDISSEAFFFKSEINNVQSKKRRDVKSLLAKLPAGSVSICKITSQLDSLTGFLSNVLLWHRFV